MGAAIDSFKKLLTHDSSFLSPSAESILQIAVSELVTLATGRENDSIKGDGDDEIMDLGVDSMSAVMLADLLSRHLLHNLEVPLEDLYVYSTLPALAGYVRSKLTEIHSEKGSLETSTNGYRATNQRSKGKENAAPKMSRARQQK